MTKIKPISALTTIAMFALPIAQGSAHFGRSASHRRLVGRGPALKAVGLI